MTIYHIILKSLINDQRGYLKVAGLILLHYKMANHANAYPTTEKDRKEIPAPVATK